MIRCCAAALTISSALLAAGCSQIRPVDHVAELRREMVQRIGGERASELVVPFELNDAIREDLAQRRLGSRSRQRQIEGILELVFDEVGLRYSRAPTRDAVGAYTSGEGNCLSFVNLFVGLAREVGIEAIYVEVDDYQRWSFEEGAVLSRGHIVAGVVREGRLTTYDFLPYRPKSYRALVPIGDRTAAAHFYNNLGAEALLAGDEVSAERQIRVAWALAPDFDKAINNLGIVLLRRGDVGQAVELLRSAVETHPDSVPLLTNLSRAYQLAGQPRQAAEILDRLEGVRQQSPYFYVYKAKKALAAGDPHEALAQAREAQRIEPDLPEVQLVMAEARLALGDVVQARRHLRRTLELDPSDERARELSQSLEPP